MGSRLCWLFKLLQLRNLAIQSLFSQEHCEHLLYVQTKILAIIQQVKLGKNQQTNDTSGQFSIVYYHVHFNRLFCLCSPPLAQKSMSKLTYQRYRVQMGDRAKQTGSTEPTHSASLFLQVGLTLKLLMSPVEGVGSWASVSYHSTTPSGKGRQNYKLDRTITDT